MKHLFIAVCTVFLFFSCNQEDDVILSQEPPLENYLNGYFIVNEGNFGKGNGSVGFINSTFTKTIVDPYYSKNKIGLGDVVQSVITYNDYLIIVVNNSNKVVVANRKTLKLVKEITTNLVNPRYAVVKNGLLYVTNWGDGMNSTDDYISVHQLSDFSFVKKITVAEGPEKIVEFNNLIYVFHKGGFNQNNKITTLSTDSKNEIKELILDFSPSSYVLKNNELYILCSGKTSYDSSWNIVIETDATLWKVSLTSTEKVLDFKDKTDKIDYVTALTFYDNKWLFILQNKIYSLEDGKNPKELKEFSSVSVNQLSLTNNQLFGISSDYTERGASTIYVLNSSGGVNKTLINGLGSNSVVWNE